MEIVKKVRKLIFPALMGVIMFSLGSCYPDNEVEAADLDVTLSFYDDMVDFSDYSTYSLPDSVVVLDEFSNQNGSSQYDAQIIARVKKNLEELGYVEEANPATNVPDVLVLVSKVINTNVEAYTYYNWWDYYGWYPYWGAYPYGYGPGWSPYYPWGGSTTVVYSYKTGTVLIDMVDVSKSNEGSMEIPTVWAGALNGLVEGTDFEISGRLDSNIDQVFNQSPYLKTN